MNLNEVITVDMVIMGIAIVTLLLAFFGGIVLGYGKGYVRGLNDAETMFYQLLTLTPKKE